MKAPSTSTALGPIVREAESTRARWLLLAVVSSAQFIATFDLWVMTIALPTLQHEFAPAELPDAAWILNVYTIVLAAFLAPSGRIADTLGHKRSFLIGLAAFGVASAGCAMASTLPVMIAWRSVQALSAALVLPTSLSLALPAFPPHERGTAIGIWSAAGAIGAGAGPVLGGLLIQASWRWIFLINVPIVLVAAVAGSLLIPRDAIVRGGVRFDGVGLVLLLAAMGLVCAGLLESAVWPALLIWSVLGVGGGLAALLVLHVLRHPEPVLPPRLFRARQFTVSAVGMLTYNVGFAVNLLGITLLLTQGMHLSVLEAAIGIIPGPISAGVTSPFSGRVQARLGARRTLLLGAALFAVAAIWPLATSGEVPSYLSTILPSLLCWGVANSFIQPTFFAGANAAPKDDLALAAAVLGAARQVGAALGVAALVGIAGGSVLSTFHSVWGIVLVSALLTAVVAAFAAGPNDARTWHERIRAWKAVSLKVKLRGLADADTVYAGGPGDREPCLGC